MKILAALVRQRNTFTLCWPFEACESVGSTLKTEPSISRWQLTTSFEDTMANFENLAALLQQKEHRRRPMKVRTLKTEPSISQRRLATTSRT